MSLSKNYKYNNTKCKLKFFFASNNKPISLRKRLSYSGHLPVYDHDGNYYTQTHGVTMGSPLGSI